VAREILQHNVLGVLLGIGKQLRRAQLVACGIRGARPVAGDRAQLRVAGTELHQRLGRGAHHRHLAERAVIHVGRGVDEPQRAVGLKRVELVTPGKAAREHQLVDITRSDVLLHAPHSGEVILVRVGGTWRRVASAAAPLSPGLAKRPFPAAIALIWFQYLGMSRHSEAPAWYMVTHPIASALFIYTMLRSMVVTLVRGGIEWRGTTYSLSEIRKYQA